MTPALRDLADGHTPQETQPFLAPSHLVSIGRRPPLLAVRSGLASLEPLTGLRICHGCFPPVFNPMELSIDPSTLEDGTYNGDDRDQLVANIGLTDGGVYDNLGLEPVIDTHG